MISRLLPGLALVATPFAALADGAFTFRILGGASALQDTDLDFGAGPDAQGFDVGFATIGALGYDYAGSPWRSEVEFAYRTVEPEGFDGDFASTSVMLNGYYDFASSGAWTPYIGFGLGLVTEIDLDVESGASIGEYSDRGGVAGQIMLGASYAVSPRWAFDTELRYFDAGSRTLDADDGGSVDASYSSFEAQIGLRFTF